MSALPYSGTTITGSTRRRAQPLTVPATRCVALLSCSSHTQLRWLRHVGHVAVDAGRGAELRGERDVGHGGAATQGAGRGASEAWHVSVRAATIEAYQMALGCGIGGCRSRTRHERPPFRCGEGQPASPAAHAEGPEQALSAPTLAPLSSGDAPVLSAGGRRRRARRSDDPAPAHLSGRLARQPTPPSGTQVCSGGVTAGRLTCAVALKISRRGRWRGRFATGPNPSQRKGPSVEPVRPRASDDVSPDTRDARESARRGESGLTRAQAHALRRCEPLAPAHFKAKRLVAEQGISPLRPRDDAGASRGLPRNP